MGCQQSTAPRPAPDAPLTNTIRLEFRGLDAMVRDVESSQIMDPYADQQGDQQPEEERYP